MGRWNQVVLKKDAEGHICTGNIAGVTSCYLFHGGPKTTSAIHLEGNCLFTHKPVGFIINELINNINIKIICFTLPMFSIVDLVQKSGLESNCPAFQFSTNYSKRLDCRSGNNIPIMFNSSSSKLVNSLYQM
jgi:hypothetical protein